MSALETLGHYEILRPIGAGGMGEVYVARDSRLGRKVAIKVLPLRGAPDRDTLARFTQEARSASALNHPNIITIHEVGTSEQGTPFMVMEYVEGEDLRMKIHRGAPSIREVLDLATQIADGLAAAHDRGIVHRDLKPENVMITRDGFVKILDFGLAKMTTPSPDETDHTLLLDVPATNPGTILGTVGYMSPEQATGRLVDFRSDQFAFGAILYELVTGKPAFEGETAIDTLSAILHHDPPPVQRTKTRAPEQLSDVIRRLLAKSPDERYASTRDLARELRLLRDRIAAEESGFHRRDDSQKPRLFRIAATTAIVLIVFGSGFVLLRREPPSEVRHLSATFAPAPATAKYLAVTGFRDLTGDPTGQLVVDGFGEALTARLAGYSSVQVMRPRPSDAETDLRKIARNLGANLVLSGSVMRSGERIRVTWSVLDPASGREWRDLVEGSVANLFALQDDVAESVAAQLDLGRGRIRTAFDPETSQTRYLEALGHLRRYDSQSSIESAIRILRGLGDSPAVQAALARAYLYQFDITKEPALAAAAFRAAEQALAADPQSIDVNLTLGELRRRTGRYPESIDAFLLVLSQQPNNADAVLGLAETHKAAGDATNAETFYRRAIALQPNYWGGYNKLGAFYYGQGRYGEAVPLFQKVVQLVPDNLRGYNNLGGMYQRLGRYDEAIRTFSASIARQPSAQGYSNLGTSLYYAGRFAEAAEATRRAVEMAPDDYMYWRNLGDAWRWTPGRAEDAERAFARTVELCDASIRLNSADALAHTLKAGALAKLGRHDVARGAILRALEIEPRDPTLVYEAALVALLSGAQDEAAARLQQAIRLGFSRIDAEHDPEFAEWRKSGRLREVLTQPVSN